MTPNSHLYLDYYQGDASQEPLAIGGFNPLEKVYAYEPVPADLTSAEARHVLGAQGNVWTEYMRTTDYVEYMVFPRALALSEVVWSSAAQRDWEGFTKRLPHHLDKLDAQGVNFRIPDVLGLEEDRLSLEDSAWVELSGAVAGGELRYTLDGTDPGAGSPRYDAPFMIPVNEDGTEVAARVYLRDGRAGAVRRSRFMRTHLMPPASVPLNGRTQGLAVQGFSGRFRSVDDIEAGDSFDLTDLWSSTSPSLPRFAIPDGASESSFGLIFRGFIRVPRKGIYTFHLSSDDGSRLTVGDLLVINHDGPHSMAERAGQVALHRGWHPIEVRYFQAGGGYGLRLELEGPELPRRELSARWLAHVKEPAGAMGGRP
ncbi:MAG: family 20 glycosylhydrolase, partial [Longimicrobiales bacterium]|nr:family 20 glycosylhydrolase [Longimicrobiales bacterium]